MFNIFNMFKDELAERTNKNYKKFKKESVTARGEKIVEILDCLARDRYRYLRELVQFSEKEFWEIIALSVVCGKLELEAGCLKAREKKFMIKETEKVGKVHWGLKDMRVTNAI